LKSHRENNKVKEKLQRIETQIRLINQSRQSKAFAKLGPCQDLFFQELEKFFKDNEK
jgi:replicative DNA helicase